MAPDTCPQCTQPCRGLYQIVTGDRPFQTAFVGYCCVPLKVRARYPQWEARETERAHRAELARRNFNHAQNNARV